MALRLDFVVNNKATPEIKKLQSDLTKLQPRISGVEKSFNKLDSSLVSMTKNVVGAYIGFQTLSKTYDLVIGTGLSYNKTLEQQKASIATLELATSSYIKSLSDVLSPQERFNLAQQESVKTLTELERINSKLPTTLKQTADIYKAILPSFREAGASQDDLINLTEKLAIAQNVAGIEANSFTATIDSIASGTVVASSDLGKFLNALGLTNDVLKESNNVTKLVLDTFKDFQTLDTFATATSNLEDEWDKLTGTLTKTAFGTQKQAIKDLTKSIKDLNQDKGTLEDINNLINSVFSGIIKGANLVAKPIAGFVFAIDTIDLVVTNLGLQVEKTFINISANISDAIVGIQKNVLSVTPEFLANSLGVTAQGIKEAEKEAVKLRIEALKIEEKQNKNLLENRKLIDSIVSGMTTLDKLSNSYVENLKDANKEADKLPTAKFPSSTDSVGTSFNLEAFKKLEQESYTNQRTLLDDFLNRWEDSNDEFAKDFSDFASKSISSALTTALNNFAQGQSTSGSGLATGIGAGAVGVGVASLVPALGLGAGGAGALIAGGLLAQRAFGRSKDDGSATVNALVSKIEAEANARDRAINEGIVNSLNLLDDSFKDFISSLNNVTSSLESLGSRGTSFVTEFEQLTRQISSLSDVSFDSQKQGALANLRSAEAYLQYWENRATQFATNDGILNKETERLAFRAQKSEAQLGVSSAQKALQGVLDQESAIATQIAELEKRSLDLILDNVSNSLDFSLLTFSQLNNLIGDFNKSEYQRTLKDINDISVAIKQQGGTITEQQKQDLLELYSLPNYVLGQDYKEAINILDTTFNTIIDYVYELRGATDFESLDSARFAQQRALESVQQFQAGAISATDLTSTLRGLDELLSDSIKSALANTLESTLGFADGGYTGDGGRNQIAGIVHKGEYVMNQEQVRNNPSTVAFLEGQRHGGRNTSGQYQMGGMVSGVNGSSSVEDKLQAVIMLLNSILVNNDKQLKIVQEWNVDGVPQGEQI